MNEKILVTYASRSSSTAGVAEAIGKTLVEEGRQVEVLPLNEIKDLAPYRAVVVGSAIHGGQWLPEAMQFVKTHQEELARKPFAPFLVCMTLALNGKLAGTRPPGDIHEQVVAWLNPVCALVKPVSKGLFAGALNIDKIPSLTDRLKFRLSVILGVWSEGDHRDWHAIHNWAKKLIPLLTV